VSDKIKIHFLIFVVLYLERVILPQNDNGVQVACGQNFSICLTSNGKIVIWGSISGKTTNDDGFFYEKPE
jgi:alpha-tubulin suppressor-like RCC1 family protein